MESKELLLRIKEQRAFASPTEKNIIDFILADPQAAVGKSIHGLAEATYTSASSVVRFCHKMGCKGYREFIRSLVVELATTQASHEIALQNITPSDTVDQVVAKVLQRNIKSIEATALFMDPDTLATCADLIARSRAVSLFGVGQSLLVANDLQLKLLRADIPCDLYSDWHNQLLCAKNIHADDVAIVVSYSGMTREIVEAAKWIKGRNAPLIAITRGSEVSPLSKMADYVLGVAATELIERGSAMASRISQLAVVDALYATYVLRNYDRCMDQFSRNWISKSR